MKTRRRTAKTPRSRRGVSAARLAEMIEEATVDAYGESEQTTSWCTMLENHLELPFETEVLGVRVAAGANTTSYGVFVRLMLMAGWEVEYGHCDAN